MCTLGTHTVSFAANDRRDAEVRRCFENLDVGGLMSNPLNARGTAEEEARKENKPGTYTPIFVLSCGCGRRMRKGPCGSAHFANLSC